MKTYNHLYKTLKMSKRSLLGVACLILLNIFGSCRKFTQVDAPITSPVSSTVYRDDATAASALAGIFSTMTLSSSFFGAFGSADYSMGTIAGMSADEFKNFSLTAPFPNAYANHLTTTDVNIKSNFLTWQTLYKIIYLSNSMIDGVSKSTGVSQKLKQQILGEAEFCRAFCYFYLVNLYGDVPLATSSDYLINAKLARTAKSKVYQQIESDLKEAQNNLSNDFITPIGSLTSERTLPNRGAATALLARVYLYMGDHWQQAESQADSLINNASNYSLLSDLNQVFLKNSQEAIWQIQPTQPGGNTPDGATYFLFGAPNQYNQCVSLTKFLINAFEDGDLRKATWVSSLIAGGETYYYPSKYKLRYTGAPPEEYQMMLRLSEQYLIRAEARLQQANITGAISDLNIIRNRAGLPNYSGDTGKSSLLSAILHERQVELFTEWGHRWLDLKRTNKVDSVMSIVTPQKGTYTWNTNQQLYPIPLADIQTDHNLTQNPGY